jgi:hypothetical protein
MGGDLRKETEKKLIDARRIQMAHYLADRHPEGDKLKPLIAQLERLMREHGWKIPE